MVSKKVFITGISGFVGSHLAECLLGEGNEVYGLIRRRADGSKPKNLVDKNIQGEVHLIEGDITNIASIGLALRKVQAEIVFHLASQSFVPRSFENPLETIETNTLGTINLLEALRLSDLDPLIIFAGSSEEYGLVFSSQKQYETALSKYKAIYPEPERIPELPISEKNYLRPMSPYATSKVHCDYLMRNYHTSYGMKTIVSRSFNTEGAGRGSMFVTSSITNQVMKLKLKENDKIVIGNINAFRDWSHISDIVGGYCLLVEKGTPGEIYNQGSMRTNSVLSYILLSLENAGWEVRRIESMSNKDKVVDGPTQRDNEEMFGLRFEKTKVDRLILADEIEFSLEDRGLWIYTDAGKIPLEFDPNRFRPAEVPILLSDCRKFQQLGFSVERSLDDIISDQLTSYMDGRERKQGE
jgi:GDPmannose 4,6-dehydratase